MTSLTRCHDSDLCSNTTEIHSGEVDSTFEYRTPSIDDVDIPIALWKGVRSCTFHPIGNFVNYDRLSSSYRAFVTTLGSVQVHKSIYEALKHPGWKKATNEEIEALEKNGTWVLSDLPRRKKPISCRWIFTIKHKADGSIERLKARSVAKGFTQSYDIDYQVTFAPVAKLNTVRILLSLATNYNWPFQLDVKNAFLSGDLAEEVYMEVSGGSESTLTRNKVCKLQKSLYGPKQSPRAWFDRFARSLIKYRYI